ncbi:uncharacterized protein LOC135282184 isoform X2 [Passer domesticus]
MPAEDARCQVPSRQTLESNQDLRYREELRRQSLERAPPKHTRPSQRPRPTGDGFCQLVIQKLSVGAHSWEKGKNLYYHRRPCDVSLAEQSVAEQVPRMSRERVSPRPHQSLCRAGQFRPVSAFSRTLRRQPPSTLDIVVDLSPEELAFGSGAIATITRQSLLPSLGPPSLSSILLTALALTSCKELHFIVTRYCHRTRFILASLASGSSCARNLESIR